MPDTAYDAIEILVSFYDSPDKWCRYDTAQDSDKDVCSPLEKEACRWCVFGAVNRIAYDKYFRYGQATNHIMDALDTIANLTEFETGIISLNDMCGYDTLMEILKISLVEHEKYLRSIKMPEEPAPIDRSLM